MPRSGATGATGATGSGSFKGNIRDFLEDFPDFKIDSILAIFGVFVPFPGV